MRFARLLVVFLAITIFCGGFGATVGGLFGFGASGPLSAYGGLRTYTPDPNAPRVEDGSVRGFEAGFGRPGEERHTGIRGAAIGGALGLLIGALLAAPVALLDQALVAGRTLLRERGGPDAERS